MLAVFHRLEDLPLGQPAVMLDASASPAVGFDCAQRGNQQPSLTAGKSSTAASLLTVAAQGKVHSTGVVHSSNNYSAVTHRSIVGIQPFASDTAVGLIGSS